MEERKVVVVGAGPAGSSAARKIAETKHDVLLLEKDQYAGKSSVCGGGLLAGYAVDLQLPSRLVEKRMDNWTMYFPERTYTIKEEEGLSFQRSIFDRFLAEEAARKGADLRLSSLVTRVDRKSSDLVVRVKDLTINHEYEVKTKLVIFADGPHTLAIRHDFGFRKARPENIIHAAIYELSWKDNPLNCFEFFFDEQISPWGYGWVFPKRDVLNVGVGCLASKMQGSLKDHLDFFVDGYERVSSKLRNLKKVRFAAASIPLSHASRIVADNMMVIGDAAGMVDPVWGGGIGPAIKAATIAGRTAVDAIECERYDAEALSTFEHEWKKGFDYQYIRKAHRMLGLFIALSKIDPHAFSKFMRIGLRQWGARRLRSTGKLASEGATGIATSPVIEI